VTFEVPPAECTVTLHAPAACEGTTTVSFLDDRWRTDLPGVAQNLTVVDLVKYRPVTVIRAPPPSTLVTAEILDTTGRRAFSPTVRACTTGADAKTTPPTMHATTNADNTPQARRIRTSRSPHSSRPQAI
jgi:hypothetical protein